MNKQELINYIHQRWDDSILEELIKFIRIPNKSPQFDPNWQQHGYMDEAVDLVVGWCEQQIIPGLKLEVVRRLRQQQN